MQLKLVKSLAAAGFVLFAAFQTFAIELHEKPFLERVRGKCGPITRKVFLLIDPVVGTYQVGKWSVDKSVEGVEWVYDWTKKRLGFEADRETLSINPELIHAARLDRAEFWEKFDHSTLEQAINFGDRKTVPAEQVGKALQRALGFDRVTDANRAEYETALRNWIQAAAELFYDSRIVEKMSKDSSLSKLVHPDAFKPVGSKVFDGTGTKIKILANFISRRMLYLAGEEISSPKRAAIAASNIFVTHLSLPTARDARIVAPDEPGLSPAYFFHRMGKYGTTPLFFIDILEDSVSIIQFSKDQKRLTSLPEKYRKVALDVMNAAIRRASERDPEFLKWRSENPELAGGAKKAGPERVKLGLKLNEQLWDGSVLEMAEWNDGVLELFAEVANQNRETILGKERAQADNSGLTEEQINEKDDKEYKDLMSAVLAEVGPVAQFRFFSGLHMALVKKEGDRRALTDRMNNIIYVELPTRYEIYQKALNEYNQADEKIEEAAKSWTGLTSNQIDELKRTLRKTNSEAAAAKLYKASEELGASILRAMYVSSRKGCRLDPAMIAPLADDRRVRDGAERRLFAAEKAWKLETMQAKEANLRATLVPNVRDDVFGPNNGRYPDATQLLKTYRALPIRYTAPRYGAAIKTTVTGLVATILGLSAISAFKQKIERPPVKDTLIWKLTHENMVKDHILDDPAYLQKKNDLVETFKADGLPEVERQVLADNVRDLKVSLNNPTRTQPLLPADLQKRFEAMLNNPKFNYFKGWDGRHHTTWYTLNLYTFSESTDDLYNFSEWMKVSIDAMRFRAAVSAEVTRLDAENANIGSTELLDQSAKNIYERKKKRMEESSKPKTEKPSEKPAQSSDQKSAPVAPEAPPPATK